MCLGFDFEIFSPCCGDLIVFGDVARLHLSGRYFGTWPKNKASQERNLLPLPVLSALQAVKLLRLIIPANESLTVFTLHTHRALSILLPTSGVALGGPNTQNLLLQIRPFNPLFVLPFVEKFPQISLQRINSRDNTLFHYWVENLRKNFELTIRTAFREYEAGSRAGRNCFQYYNFNVLPRESKDPRRQL